MRMKKELKRIEKWIIAALITIMGMTFGLHGMVKAADKFPSRSITIINPFKPGGGTDIEVRNLAPFLQKYLGEPIVIKSMPGAATTIAATAAEASKPNGYTLIAVVLPDVILAQEFHNSGTHMQNFEPVYGWFEGPMSVEVKGDSPFNTLADLIEAGKKKKLKAALSGVGSIDHLHTLLLEKYMGIQTITVPYGGGGPAAKAGMSGEVDFLVGVSTTAVRFVRDGKLKILAVMGPKRVEALKDAPTIYELGYKDYPNISFIRAMMTPPGTPKGALGILEEAFKKAVDDPEFRAVMKKQGRPVVPFSSGEMKEAVGNTYKLAQEYMPFMKKGHEKK
ncbi:MAG: tripartite tricarboxylate transporter substrate binding protein [Pseudomonadota bacterium]